ncbi:AraC family transcriptional regulator [Bacteroides stercorirosoris]|uniref:AraC family transcriptional regulator n=1 Tax=Bacteroides stercorirosoris TaxID=871324 RepID=A0A413H198_9BACE|nr:AraC family transcriptional regulator [Bacteroides stercorirosoris]
MYSWISQSLMCEVCKVLDETNIPISQIAEELNFSDQAVLSKFFKRYKGVSPLNYRNR